MKLRIRYSKTDLVRFISHLDLMRVFFRAFERSGFPVSYTQGFSPHPKVEFCPPLKVGMEGGGELLDAFLREEVDIRAAISTLNGVFPSGIVIQEARTLAPNDPPLGKAIRGAEYSALLPRGMGLGEGELAAFLSRSESPVVVVREARTRSVDARKGVRNLSLAPGAEKRQELKLLVSLPGAAPAQVLKALTGKTEPELAGTFWRRLRFIGDNL